MQNTEATDTPSKMSKVLSHNARIGLILFFIYLALYIGFILLSAFTGSFMAGPAVGGVNIAVIYGFSLIIGAFLLALVYMILCKSEPTADPAQKDQLTP